MVVHTAAPVLQCVRVPDTLQCVVMTDCDSHAILYKSWVLEPNLYSTTLTSSSNNFIDQLGEPNKAYTILDDISNELKSAVRLTAKLHVVQDNTNWTAQQLHMHAAGPGKYSTKACCIGS